MANYQEIEENVTKKSWKRAFEILLSNPSEGVPSATFNEEILTLVGSDSFREKIGSFTTPMMSGTTRIPYINENYEQILDADGNVISQASFTLQDYMNMTACLYIACAKIRDSQV
jgi:hypothetical protein